MAHSKSEIKKAKNLLSKYAPKGEQLAYINSKEANLLKSKGGAGKMTKAGIRSYAYSDSRDDPGGDNQTSSSPSNDGGGGDNDNNFNASAARFTPTQPKSMLSRIGDFIKGGGFTGMAIRAIGKSFANQKQKGALWDDPFGTGMNKVNIPDSSNGGGNDPPPARNVGGRIVKLSPTTAEISQSSATDAAAYDNRKTKAKGRSMTIMTSSRGINRNNTLTLGKPSLLGA
jgi:hypothetical protein